MENIRYHHGTLAGDNCFNFFPVLAFFLMKKNIVGSGVNLKSGSVG
jgi:hypothetical protein